MKKWLIITALLATFIMGSVQAEDIWYKGVAQQYSYTKYATFLAEYIKIEFGVWPISYGHAAGIVYTDDQWETVRVAEASWITNTQGIYGSWDELWSVWISGSGDNGGSMGQPFSPFTIEFALYVIDPYGNVYWDNNYGYNHSISVD